MALLRSIINVFDFKGRTSRKDFWWTVFWLAAGGILLNKATVFQCGVPFSDVPELARGGHASFITGAQRRRFSFARESVRIKEKGCCEAQQPFRVA